jgi:hypothetical protein
MKDIAGIMKFRDLRRGQGQNGTGSALAPSFLGLGLGYCIVSCRLWIRQSKVVKHRRFGRTKPKFSVLSMPRMGGQPAYEVTQRKNGPRRLSGVE